jgi:phospholipase C
VETGDVELALINRAHGDAIFVITTDVRYPAVGQRQRRMSVAPGGTVRDRWNLQASAHWYDLAIRVEGVPAFCRRFAGKTETGRRGLTDPGISSMVWSSEEIPV